MLRTGIPFDVLLRQPDGVIETAIHMLNEQARRDADPGDGPRMSG